MSRQTRKDCDPLGRAIAWCRREYARNRRETSEHCSHTAARVMEQAEKQFGLDTSGVNGVEGFAFNSDAGIQYLNTGDSYGRTILFRASSCNMGRWSLGSWGDIVERMI